MASQCFFPVTEWGASLWGQYQKRRAAGEITCVFGVGPVGLGMTLFQTRLGAQVIAVDINPLALERAKKMGAWKTINPKETSDLKAAIWDLTSGL